MSLLEAQLVFMHEGIVDFTLINKIRWRNALLFIQCTHRFGDVMHCYLYSAHMFTLSVIRLTFSVLKIQCNNVECITRKVSYHYLTLRSETTASGILHLVLSRS